MNKISKEIISGRLRLHATQTDKFKMARFSLNFILPKDKQRSPLTKLMLSVIMRGSKKYPTITEINKSLDRLYGATVSLRSLSFGDKSVFQISCKVLDNKYRLSGDDTDILSEVLKIVSEIISEPLRDENGLLLSSYVESERKIAIDVIRSQINDQRAYASKKCDKLMLKDTPYGISTSGDIDILSEITAKQLTENIAWFQNNARLECYYVGCESASRIEELTRTYFNLPDSCAPEIEYQEKAFESCRNDVQYACESMDISQSRLEMGYRCGTVLSDKEYYAMTVFNEIFGGTSVSKLFMNVREKKSLCYYCYSSYHSATGTIKVGCGIKPSNKDVTMEEIARQLVLMQNGDFTDDDISMAKRSIISGLRQINDSPAAIEMFMLRRLIGGVTDNESTSIEKINAVGREDIVAAAQRVTLDTVYFLTGNGEEESYDE